EADLAGREISAAAGAIRATARGADARPLPRLGLRDRGRRVAVTRARTRIGVPAEQAGVPAPAERPHLRREELGGLLADRALAAVHVGAVAELPAVERRVV